MRTRTQGRGGGQGCQFGPRCQGCQIARGRAPGESEKARRLDAPMTALLGLLEGSELRTSEMGFTK